MSSPAYNLVKKYNFAASSILTDKTQLAINDARCISGAGAFVPPVASTFTPQNGSAVQQPRIKENVTIEADGTASDGFLIRCWNRQAPAGVYSSYPAPWTSVNKPATAGAWHAVAPGTVQTYGGYRYRARRTVSGTGGWKGVLLLWPQSGGWSNVGANEMDIEEWYNYFSGGTNKGANTNLHGNGGTAKNINEYQWQTGKQNPNPWAAIDTTVWHTVEIQWAKNFFDIWVGDGNGANMVRVVHKTDPNYIPKVPMWIGVQTAMLEQYYQANGVRGTDYFDIDWLEVYATDGNGVCPNVPVLTGSNNGGGGGGVTNQPPSVPQGVVAQATNQNAIHLLWSPSVDTVGAGLAGYHVYRSLSPTGPFTLVATVTKTAYLDTGLLANTAYYYQVKAFDGATPPAESDTDATTACTTLNTVNALPNAVLSISPTSGASPLTVTAVLSGSTGTGITNVSMDWGDGSSPDSYASLAAVPVPYQHTYTGSTACTASLTITNANGQDVDQQVVTPIIPNSAQTANLGMPYAVESKPVSAAQFNTTLDQIDGGLSAAALQQGSYQSETTVVFSSMVNGDSYPRLVIYANGQFFIGDGTFDPTTTTPVLGLGSTGGTGTQSASNESFAFAVSTTTGTGSNTVYAATLPTGLGAGYMIAALSIKDTNSTAVTTPSGWTLLGSQANTNGGCKLWLYGKAMSSADSNTTLSITAGNSQPGLLAVLGYNNATAVDGTALFASGSGTSAQQSIAAPSMTPATGNEFMVLIYMARSTNNSQTGGVGLTAPSAATQRTKDGTSLASGNQIGLLTADEFLTGTTASGAQTATCGTAFTVAAAVLLNHA